MQIDQFLGKRAAGWGMVGLGALLGLIGALYLWAGVSRWFAIEHLRDSRLETFADRPDVAATMARRAATYRNAAATAIAAIDLDDPASDRILANLERSVESYEGRRAVRNTRAFGRVLRGEAPEGNLDTSTADGRLLAYMDELNRVEGDRLPSFPDLDQAPDPVLQLAAHERRLRHAWLVGDLASIRMSAGALVTLAPGHPAGPHCDLLTYAIKPIDKDWHRLLNTIAKPVANQAERASVLRAAARIAPANAGVLLSKVPDSQRNGEELVAAMLKANASLKDIVSQAARLNDQKTLDVVAARCLKFDDIEQLSRLQSSGSPEFQKKIAIVLATRRYDIAALEKLGADISVVKPRVINLQAGFNWLAFHVVDGYGDPPRVAIAIEANGQMVPADQIKRVGSLVWLRQPGKGRVKLKVAIRGRTFFDQEVIR